MTLAGIFIGLLNCLVLAIILVIVGAVIQWLCAAFSWPIPANIVKLFLALVLLVTLICVISLLLGSPMFHLIHVGGMAVAPLHG